MATWKRPAKRTISEYETFISIIHDLGDIYITAPVTNLLAAAWAARYDAQAVRLEREKPSNEMYYINCLMVSYEHPQYKQAELEITAMSALVQGNLTSAPESLKKWGYDAAMIDAAVAAVADGLAADA